MEENSVFTKLKGLSKKDKNTSLNSAKDDINQKFPKVVYDLSKEKKYYHHRDIKEIGDELNNIDDVFMNKHAMHLIDLLTGYVKDEHNNLPMEARYFALEQVFRSSVTKEIFEKYLSDEECEIHTNRALDYLFACMTPSLVSIEKEKRG